MIELVMSIIREKHIVWLGGINMAKIVIDAGHPEYSYTQDNEK